jgi:hypothetical protein
MMLRFNQVDPHLLEARAQHGQRRAGSLGLGLAPALAAAASAAPALLGRGRRWRRRGRGGDARGDAVAARGLLMLAIARAGRQPGG